MQRTVSYLSQVKKRKKITASEVKSFVELVMAVRDGNLADFVFGRTLASKTTMARCAVGSSHRLFRAVSALSRDPTTVCFAVYSSASPRRAFPSSFYFAFPSVQLQHPILPAPQAPLSARKASASPRRAFPSSFYFAFTFVQLQHPILPAPQAPLSARKGNSFRDAQADDSRRHPCTSRCSPGASRRPTVRHCRRARCVDSGRRGASLYDPSARHISIDIPSREGAPDVLPAPGSAAAVTATDDDGNSAMDGEDGPLATIEEEEEVSMGLIGASGGKEKARSVSEDPDTPNERKKRDLLGLGLGSGLMG